MVTKNDHQKAVVVAVDATDLDAQVGQDVAVGGRRGVHVPVDRDPARGVDHVQKLDLPNMTAVIRGLFEVVAEFATRPERPVYNEKGRRTLRLDK